MANHVRKSEHNGAKHGEGAFWGRKKEAKAGSRKRRRQADKVEVDEYILAPRPEWHHSAFRDPCEDCPLFGEHCDGSQCPNLDTRCACGVKHECDCTCNPR